MNKKFTGKAVQDFIDEHLYDDAAKLALSKSPFPDILMRELVVQITGKRAAKEKLPTYFQTKNILYPAPVSMEQASSEITANYKASLCAGKSVVDLTGGFGVDSWAFSKRFMGVVYCEQNLETAFVAEYNFPLLGAENILAFRGDGMRFLRNSGKFDLIYLDPSRRDRYNRKMHAFSDCTPDVVANMETFFEHSDNVLIKASPMFDITRALQELRYVAEVHVCAVKNEVKEVLYLLNKEKCGALKNFTVNFLNETDKQEFSFSETERAGDYAIFTPPLRYLYELNPAVMKMGVFGLVSARFAMGRLHQNSQLYSSHSLKKDFPGRIFEIKDVLPYRKREGLTRANVTTRNFPDTPAQVMKKLKIKEGGEDYLFCTTLLDEKPTLLLCRKIT